MPVIGTQQSPIRIVSKKTLLTSFPPNYLIIDYADKRVSGTFKNENFIFAKPLPGVTFRGDKWLLHKIHIHMPAEHLIDATPTSAFECHLVHLRQRDPCELDEKLVIGAFFKISPTAPALFSFADIEEAIKKQLGKAGQTAPGIAKWAHGDAGSPAKVNPVHFLPKDRTEWNKWFHYEGSLTSGIYSEDVSWFILPTLAEVREDEVMFLASHMAQQHARDVCRLDRRFVLRNFGAIVLSAPPSS